MHLHVLCVYLCMYARMWKFFASVTHTLSHTHTHTHILCLYTHIHPIHTHIHHTHTHTHTHTFTHHMPSHVRRYGHTSDGAVTEADAELPGTMVVRAQGALSHMSTVLPSPKGSITCVYMYVVTTERSTCKPKR
jgi:hypothetical protein